MSYYQFNRQKLDKKDTYHNCGRKEKPAEHYIPNKAFFFFKKKQKISIATCLNMKRIVKVI